MVTLHDVAKFSGTSVGTVSRVLNGSPHVSEVARLRVLRAIDELNFTPNRAAQSLRTSRTTLAGLIVPDITNSFFGALARALARELWAHDYGLILADTAESLEKQTEALDALGKRGVDGLFLVPTTSTRDIANPLNIPLVTLDRTLADLPGVTSDNRQGTSLAVSYLHGWGHRRIATIVGPTTCSTAAERLEGYATTTRALGIYSRSLIREGPFSYAFGKQAMEELLDEPTRPTAVIASNDSQAIGALHACAGRGLRVPQDISICGFDGSELASHLSPSLTSVKQPISTMATHGARLMLELIETGTAGSGAVLLTDLTIGESCSVPPSH
ncbi:MAG: LacI family transcriptional regulator [Naasia sp.]|jgi:LacI family transcriptional regulator|uniref:LacI family DNA-binding transcriptional regulator n=1 Tax=Naasia sp. TaxID=2546198 RepID=UPI00260E08D8|nr:LacI family DNA-binding transcriptional regulator [Naasia sp.]MCU1570827.1 LacI family transcriptional regulator [Naasia sp.]